MADIQPTADPVFFKPLTEHDNLNGAYLLWKIASLVKLSSAGCWVRYSCEGMLGD